MCGTALVATCVTSLASSSVAAISSGWVGEEVSLTWHFFEAGAEEAQFSGGIRVKDEFGGRCATMTVASPPGATDEYEVVVSIDAAEEFATLADFLGVCDISNAAADTADVSDWSPFAVGFWLDQEGEGFRTFDCMAVQTATGGDPNVEVALIGINAADFVIETDVESATSTQMGTMASEPQYVYGSGEFSGVEGFAMTFVIDPNSTPDGLSWDFSISVGPCSDDPTRPSIDLDIDLDYYRRRAEQGGLPDTL